ncbi:MAG: thymidine phosphorylase [Anaerolineales bacterium]|nr:thymidine phosphorylase [Anaerolineales bacterium]MDW8162343.1 thymidine phosphorylase [Anaerolineales bacterium]
MRAVDIIAKKRDKQELTAQEIEWFIQGFTRGEIPDYQVAAWAMAVVLNGMTNEETVALTLAMARSGEMLDLSLVAPTAVDKHSTGGVGDKTTLVVAPLVAACGLPVGKISGRGLGFSGGTLDKLESIRGFRANLTREQFLRQLAEVGVVVCGQTADLAPADGKLYALRDVTGTVRSIPLIASSIMSKKIAAGARAIVLDVKVGLGAFMKTLAEAEELAKLMVEIARQTERKAVAYLSDMNQPLGVAVGNALELREAIDTLQNRGPRDFEEHCLEIASRMLVIGGQSSSMEAARLVVEQALRNGAAWQKFLAWIEAQGGDLEVVLDPQKLPRSEIQREICAPVSGYVHRIDAEKVGTAAVLLGAGRAKKGDAVDYGVGIEVHHKVGEVVHKSDPLFTVHANTEADIQKVGDLLSEAVVIREEPAEPPVHFYGVIE